MQKDAFVQLLQRAKSPPVELHNSHFLFVLSRYNPRKAFYLFIFHEKQIIFILFNNTLKVLATIRNTH